MIEPDFKKELGGIVKTELAPLLGRKVVLWDLPYHKNIGDLLIWQGTLDLLEDIGARVLQCRSFATCTFPTLDKDTTIVLNGGGNFGTLYPYYGEFRRKVLSRYPDNRVIIMPQSVYYDNTDWGRHILGLDREAICSHKNLVLCARDKYSYEFMNANFAGAETHLVPDAAFCIRDSRLEPYRNERAVKSVLYNKA